MTEMHDHDPSTSSSGSRRIPAAAAAVLRVAEAPGDFELAAAATALLRLPAPSRPETAKLVAGGVHAAFEEMPRGDVMWEDGQYIHSSLYPLRMVDEDDMTLAIAAADLRILRDRPDYQLDWWAPIHAIQHNLENRLGGLLRALAER